jgi:Anaphase-promoting complex subunit 5
MAERPTPFSLALCALIQVYHDDSETSPLTEGNPKWKVQLARFMHQYTYTKTNCLNLESAKSSSVSPTSCTSLVQSASYHATIQPSVPTIACLLDDLEDVVEDDMIVKRFHDCLQVIASSCDALVDFMTGLHHEFATGQSDNGTSQQILYVRAIVLGWDQLSFSQVTLLYKTFAQQVQDYGKSMSRKSTEGGRISDMSCIRKSVNSSGDNVDYNASGDTDREGDDGDRDRRSAKSTINTNQWPQLSSQQCHSAIVKQCREFEQQQLSPQQLQHISNTMDAITQQFPTVSAAHLLRFLCAWQSGDRTVAADAWHSYLDQSSSASTFSPQGTATSLTSSVHDDVLPVAAIVLAHWHDTHGETSLVNLALEEAIRVAQQSHHPASIALALGWLGHMQMKRQQEQGVNGSRVGSVPSVQNTTALQGPASFLSSQFSNHQDGDYTLSMSHCITRATDCRLRSIVTGAHLSYALHHADWQAWQASVRELSHGANEALRPTNTFSLGGSASQAMDGPTHVQDWQTREQLMRSLARQASVAPLLADYHLQAPVNKAKLALAVHADANTPAEIRGHLQTMARMCLYGYGDESTEDRNKASVQSSYRHSYTSQQIASTSTSSLSHPCTPCIYVNALQWLSQATTICNPSINTDNGSDLSTLKTDDALHRDALLIKQEWAIRRGYFDLAKTLQLQLAAETHPRLSNSTQVQRDLILQQSLYHARRKQWREAKDLAQQLLQSQGSTMRSKVDALWHCTWLHLEATPHEYTHALPTLLEGLQICDTHGWSNKHATGLSLLAIVQVRMHEPERAIETLQRAMPLLLEHEHVWVQAKAYYTMAQAYLLQVKDGGDSLSTTQRNKKYRRALKELTRSQTLFRRCHDCSCLRDVYYLKARVCHALDDIAQRDSASKMFAKLDKEWHKACHMQANVFADPLRAAREFDNLLGSD